MRLHGSDVWGHFAPMFHLVDVFAIYAMTLLGGRHVIVPSFNATEALLTIGTSPAPENFSQHCLQYCLQYSLPVLSAVLSAVQSASGLPSDWTILIWSACLPLKHNNACLM
jgi:hypothetical protein